MVKRWLIVSVVAIMLSSLIGVVAAASSKSTTNAVMFTFDAGRIVSDAKTLALVSTKGLTRSLGTGVTEYGFVVRPDGNVFGLLHDQSGQVVTMTFRPHGSEPIRSGVVVSLPMTNTVQIGSLALAVADSGRVGAFWSELDEWYLPAQSRFAVFDQDGSLVGALSVPTETVGTSYGAGLVALDDRYLAVWQQEQWSGWREVYTESLHAAAFDIEADGYVVTPTVIASWPYTWTDQHVYVSFRPGVLIMSDTVLVVYRHSGEQDVYRVVLDRDGNVVVPPTKLTTDGEAIREGWEMSLATLSGGRILLVWTARVDDTDGRLLEMRARYAVLDGQTFDVVEGPDWLPDDGYGESDHYPQILVQGAAALVSWQSRKDDGVEGVIVSAFDTKTNVFSTPILLAEGVSTRQQTLVPYTWYVTYFPLVGEEQ